MKRYAAHFACVAIIIAIAVALIHPALFFGKAFLPADLLLVMTPWRYHASELFPEFKRVHAPLLDVIQQYYPWRKFYADSMRNGELPLWNPYMFSGTPFVGNGQSAIFYPLNLLFTAMPVDVAFGWFALLHLLIAAFGMYALLSIWRLEPLCALIGACSFMMCGFVMAWLNYITVLCTAVWLPVAIAAYECGLRRVSSNVSLPEKILGAALASLPLALSALAGHMQIAFYVWLSLLAYAVVRCAQFAWEALSHKRLSAVKVVKQHVAMSMCTILLALLLSAPQLLPSVELSKMSTRVGKFDYKAILANSLLPDQWIRLVVPHFFGNYRDGTHWAPFERFNFIERTGYVGLLTLLLASVGCAFRHPMRTYGALMFTIGFLMASGSPIHFLFGIFHGVRQMVGASRALFMFDFAAAMLAGIGAQALITLFGHANSTPMACKGKVTKTPLMAMRVVILPCFISVGAIMLVTAYGIACFWEMMFLPPLSGYEWWQVCKAVVFLILSCIVLWLAVINRMRRLFLPVAACLIIADLFLFAHGLHPSCDRRMVFFWTGSLRWIKANVGEHRIMAIGTDGIKHWMPSNTPMAYGLKDVQGSDSLWTARYADFLKSVDGDLPGFSLDNPDSQLLDLASVKFFISGAPIGEVAKRRLRNIRRLPASDMWLYENMDAMPRAFMVGRWQVANSPDEARRFIKDIAENRINPRDAAIVEPIGESVQANMSTQVKTNWKASIVFDGTNMVKLEVFSESVQLLVISDAFYPGWHSYIDGESAPVHIANYVFRGVFIPPGRHSVWLIYEPTIISVGIYAACLFVALTFGCALVHLVANRKL